MVKLFSALALLALVMLAMVGPRGISGAFKEIRLDLYRGWHCNETPLPEEIYPGARGVNRSTVPIGVALYDSEGRYEGTEIIMSEFSVPGTTIPFPTVESVSFKDQHDGTFSLRIKYKHTKDIIVFEKDEDF